MRSTSRPAGRASAGLLATMVLLAALLPFARSLWFGFVWDDSFLVGPALDVRSARDVGRLVTTPFDSFFRDPGPSRYYRPAVLASLALDRAVSDAHPRGYHAQNLIWYALVCLFLWLLAWEISGAPLAATAGAVLFALHPTHPESVCFASGRTDLMAAAFLFLSLWVAARWSPRIRSDWLALAAPAVLLLPGLASKEIVLFAAPLVPLTFALRSARISPGRLARASVAVAAVVALFLAARASVIGWAPVPGPPPVEGAGAQILTSLALLARYLPLLIPGFGLSAYHEMSQVRHPDVAAAVGAIAIAALIAWLVALVRRPSAWLVPAMLLALTWLPLCCVPLLTGSLMAERFLFIPSAAIALGVALLPATLAGRAAMDAGPRFVLGASAAAALLLALLLPRVAIWRNEATLYASMVRHSPRSAGAHDLYGLYLASTSDMDGALGQLRIAHALRPESGEILLNLGTVESRLGHVDSALARFVSLTRIEPAYAEGWYALGTLALRANRPDTAWAAFVEAVRLTPDDAPAHNNLGVALEELGRTEDAIREYRTAVRIRPGYRDAIENLKRWNIAAP